MKEEHKEQNDSFNYDEFELSDGENHKLENIIEY